MQIRIKTNESLLELNGWELLRKFKDGATYRKWISNDLVVVVEYYFNDKEKYIWSYSVSNPYTDFLYLKDISITLEELKKLEVK